MAHNTQHTANYAELLLPQIKVPPKPPINPFPGLTCLNRLGIDGRTTCPVALKKIP